MYSPPNLIRNNKINIATEHLLNDYNFFSTPTQYLNRDNFYVYSNGLYILDAEMFIANKLTELFTLNTFKHYSHIRDVINQVQRFSPTISEDLINPTGITNFLNGLYYHTENKLLPHTPKIYTTKQHPQNYVNETNDNLSQHAKRLEYLNFI